MKNKILIISGILSLFLSNIVSADTIVYESKFTSNPQRPGIEYVKNMPGLDYVSFNNFYNNPNIASESYGKCPQGTPVNTCATRLNIPETEVSYEGGDERFFLIAKLCPNGVCQTGTDNPANIYNNTLTDYLKEGDIVRFSIYFHNNAKDSLTANNLKIGIDLSNINDPTNKQVIRPRGYITADNNVYHDKNGNLMGNKVATDNANMVLDSSDLYLETVYNSGKVWMNVDNIGYDDVVNINSTKTVPVEGTNVTITPQNTSVNNISILFDKLHGCFKYSGFVYFDAVVKKTPPPSPVCNEMTLTNPPTTQINGNLAYELKTNLTFSDGKMPTGVSLNIESDDPNAKIYTKLANGTYSEVRKTQLSTSSKAIFSIPTSTLINTIYYVGNKKISINIKTTNPDVFTNERSCAVDYTPPIIIMPTCTDMTLTQTPQIINGKEGLKLTPTHTFTPETVSTTTDLPPVYTRWTTTDSQGKFYTKSGTTFTEQGSSYIQNADIFSISGRGNLYAFTEVYYIGSSLLTETVTIEAKTFDDKNQPYIPCAKSITLNPSAKICEEIQVNYNSPIEEGTQSTFVSKSVDTENKLFEEKITYKVDEGYGFFTTTKCPELKDNENPKVIEFVNNQSSNTFNSKKLQANSLLALSKDDLLIKSSLITKPNSLKTEILNKSGSVLQTKQDYVREQLIDSYPVMEFENFTSIQETCNGQTEITVDPNTEVYFYAIKSSNGEKVIDITTNNTQVADCEKHLAIGAKPPTPDMPECTDLSLTSSTQIINGKSGLKLVPTHTFTPRFTRGVDTLPMVYTVWTTSDGLGKFYTKENNQFVEKGQTYKQNADIVDLTTQGKAYIFSEVYYLGEDPLTKVVTIEAKTYDSENNLFIPCVQSLTLNPIPEVPVCVDLETYDYKNPDEPEVLRSLEANSVYVLTNDTRYLGRIENTKTGYSSSEGAFIAIPETAVSSNSAPNILMATLLINTYKQIGEDLIASGFTKEIAETANMTESITVNDGSYVLFVTYKNAEDNPNALTVRAIDRSEPECEKSYPLTTDLLCLDLEVIDWNIPTMPETLKSPLKENSLYELSSIITMSKSEATQTRYMSNQGVFLIVPESSSSNLIQNYLRDNLTINTYKQIALDLQESGLSSNNTGNLPKGVTVNSSQTVFFITFVDAESDSNALIVEYAPGGFSECIKTFSLDKTPEIKECLELNIINPSGDWEYDDFTSEDEQKFQIEVITNPESYEDDIEYRWTVRPSYSGDWSRGETSSETNNTLRDIDETDEPRVVIQAYDKNTNIDLPYCRATLDYDYEETPPEIKKYVYDIKGESFKNLINIGGKATEEQASWLSKWLDDDFQFVNYLIEFTPGSAKSAEISEKYFDDGAIEGSLNGQLDYLEMAIMVEAKGSADPYVIYISEGFDEDRYLNEKIGEEKITDYDNFSTSINNLEKKYSCEESTSNVVCIANDFDEIEEDFKNGEKITLGNLNKAERIYFIIQTENNTEITDDRCKELKTTEGCGELFDNKIHFDASRKNLDEDFNLEDDEYSDDDTAQVIVLCPYIITRQGGDVFFRDVLDTGVDVNYCSEAKGGEVVIKEVIEKPYTPSTGAGDEENIVYKLPTGDICKLSNTEDSEIAEYKNVLKNFSSSVCEMEAEVSGLWKEENINKAIKSNIEKLARFGKVSGDISLSTINDLNIKGFGNLESGVFVIDGGNLTIGDGMNPFKINKSDKIPAYQTYIVINGDINIKSNILYDDSNVNPAQPKSFPSAAFIVVNGNINISNTVKQIDGILMAVEEDENTGEIKSLEGVPTFDSLLTVNGSLIGDVYDLFFNRRAIGDPLKDQGSITVRYDQRVLLNTPEGLNQLIDVTQLKTAN